MVNGSRLFDGCTLFIVADGEKVKDPLSVLYFIDFLN